MARHRGRKVIEEPQIRSASQGMNRALEPCGSRSSGAPVAAVRNDQESLHRTCLRGDPDPCDRPCRVVLPRALEGDSAGRGPQGGRDVRDQHDQREDAPDMAVRSPGCEHGLCLDPMGLFPDL